MRRRQYILNNDRLCPWRAVNDGWASWGCGWSWTQCFDIKKLQFKRSTLPTAKRNGKYLLSNLLYTELTLTVTGRKLVQTAAR